jgi:hypothetical protein
MNKYLKTYIRNRNINNKNHKEYEINYMDISNLDTESIAGLVWGSNNRENVINILLNNNMFISNLNSDSILEILDSTKDPEKVINVLLNNETFINNLHYEDTIYLFAFSKEPKRVFNVLGDKAKKYINMLDINRIENLLDNSIERDAVKNLIQKYRPDLKI